MYYLLPEQQLEKWKDEYGDIVFNGDALPYGTVSETLTRDYTSGVYFAILKYCYGNITSFSLYIDMCEKQKDSGFYSSNIKQAGQRTDRFRHFRANYPEYFL